VVFGEECQNFVVFYQAAEDGIEIVRVLHGASDLDRILTVEFGIDIDEETDEEPSP
jgi:hypothetical protein